MDSDLGSEPEAAQVASLADRQATRDVESYVGQAEREASALLAEATSRGNFNLHSYLTLAWLKGFMTGYGNVTRRLDEIIDRYERETKQ